MASKPGNAAPAGATCSTAEQFSTAAAAPAATTATTATATSTATATATTATAPSTATTAATTSTAPTTAASATTASTSAVPTVAVYGVYASDASNGWCRGRGVRSAGYDSRRTRLVQRLPRRNDAPSEHANAYSSVYGELQPVADAWDAAGDAPAHRERWQRAANGGYWRGKSGGDAVFYAEKSGREASFWLSMCCHCTMLPYNIVLRLLTVAWWDAYHILFFWSARDGEPRGAA